MTMEKQKSILNTAKAVGAGVVVIAAAFILMPGLLGYVMGLGRIVLIVGITLVLATIAGNIVFQVAKRSGKIKAAGTPPTTASAENRAQNISPTE